MTTLREHSPENNNAHTTPAELPSYPHDASRAPSPPLKDLSNDTHTESSHPLETASVTLPPSYESTMVAGGSARPNPPVGRLSLGDTLVRPELYLPHWMLTSKKKGKIASWRAAESSS